MGYATPLENLETVAKMVWALALALRRHHLRGSVMITVNNNNNNTLQKLSNRPEYSVVITKIYVFLSVSWPFST
jgi:hypothetical protein